MLAIWAQHRILFLETELVSDDLRHAVHVVFLGERYLELLRLGGVLCRWSLIFSLLLNGNSCLCRFSILYQNPILNIFLWQRSLLWDCAALMAKSLLKADRVLIRHLLRCFRILLHWNSWQQWDLEEGHLLDVNSLLSHRMLATVEEYQRVNR